jgi:hypothetical protein
MPQRIQLSRKKGWRMPPNTVKVDRSTKWGNPFIIIKDPVENRPIGAETDLSINECNTAKEAVYKFKKLLELPAQESFVKQIKQELKGKNLACWCKLSNPCHAEILLEIANT